MIQSRNIKKILMIPITLLLISSAILLTTPVVIGQTEKETYPFIVPIENPIGVNQETLLWFGITDMAVWPQTGWKDLTITVTKPDGSTETLGPFNTDTTGGTGTIYTPTMIGEYKFQAHFPQQINEYQHEWRTAPAGSIMKASDSEITTLTVQSDPIEYHSGFQLPEEYWTRPINAQFREWYRISGSYLWDDFPSTFGNTPSQHSVFQPYNQGPETAHILWRRQDVMGGLAGGEMGEHGFSDGTAYEAAWSAYIIGGVLFRNVAWPTYSHYQAVRATDLRTGEELWFKEGFRMNFGQLMYWDTMNMHGIFAYVWETDGSTWRAYDAYTGEWWYTMENVPSGSMLYGPKGELMVYTVNLEDGWMSIWNSTAAFYNWQMDLEGDNPEAAYHAGRWRPYGKTFDASYGIQTNISIPNLPGVLKNVREGVIVGSTVRPWEVAANPVEIWALSTEPGREGELIFRKTYEVPENKSRDIRDISVENGVFVVVEKETRQWYGYDLDNGEYLWGPTESQPETDHFGFGQVNWVDVIAYDKLYSGSYGGVLHAYDINTGDLLWKYVLTDEYAESFMGPNWALGIHFITDGKIYLGHFEHSSFDPLPRGAPTVCIDAESGEEIWKIDIRTGNFMGTYRAALPVIGDGVMVIQNSYDMNDYAIARGPSKTTLSIESDIVKLGDSVMIKGTVMDISPGVEEKGITLRFPNGVPAVSDASMSDWMQYVYMQYPRPTDVSGVIVKLEAVDSNNNYQDLGTTMTDMDGNFAMMYTPELSGKCMIIATFEGSKGYYGSHAMDYLGVDPAGGSSIPIEPEQPGQASTEVPLISTEIAITIAVAVIVVIGLATYWFLKRK